MKPFGVLVKERREEKNLSQKALAKAVGISAQRLSHIERCRRQPSLSEQQSLQKILGRIDGFVEPLRVTQAMRSNGLKCLPEEKRYEPPRDRATYVRFAAARRKYPEFVNRVTRALKLRPDFDACQALCHRLVADSAEEILLVLRLLELGALPSLCAPGWAGIVPHCIIDPVKRKETAYHSTACLAFEGEFFFFQVTLQSSEWQHRVDVLRCKDGAWSVLEVDGFGHDPVADAKRERQLGLPTLRMTAAMLLDRAFDLRAALMLTV